MEFSFKSFVNGKFDYDPEVKMHTGLYLYEGKSDIKGSKIKLPNLDALKDYPNVDTVTISGLDQERFEYFIHNYAKQLKAIRLVKIKKIVDLSLLGTLPQLEYIYLYANHNVSEIWDMSGNISLKGLCIHDFAKLNSIVGIETAPNLKYFEVGNLSVGTAEIESLMPLSNTKIETLFFMGKKIVDNDLSFLSNMPVLKEFNFLSNFLTTEQVAWIVSNFPYLKGYALKARYDYKPSQSNSIIRTSPITIIVGKGKPSMGIEGNEERIKNYELKFEMLVKEYKGKKYTDVF